MNHNRNGRPHDDFIDDGPPRDVEAEKLLLAYLFHDPPDSIPLIEQHVDPDDFHVPAHRAVYRAALKMWDEAQPVNEMSVGRAVAPGVLDDVGGESYLHNLGQGIPRYVYNHNVVYTAKQVREAGARRRLYYMAVEVAKGARDPSYSIDDLMELAKVDALVGDRVKEERFPLLTAADLANGDFSVEYYIRGVLAKGQNGVVGAVRKGLKTTTLIDLGISLATGTRFLDHFPVLESARCCMLSGEDSAARLKDIALRVCEQKGFDLASVDGWMVSTSIPNLQDAADLRALERLIVEHNIQVVFLDPAYICMGIEDSAASSIFNMGALLAPLTKLSEKTGVMILLAHHFIKGAIRTFDPPDLSDLTHVGFDAWARQWLLLGRRSAYQDDGRHELWLRTGGSAGHYGTYVVNVDEGLQSDVGGRRWDVEVVSQSEQVVRDTDRKSEKEQSAERDARDAVLTAVERFGDDGETKTGIRDVCGIGGGKFKRIFADLFNEGLIEQCEIAKGNSRTYPGFRRTRPHPSRQPDRCNGAAAVRSPL